MNRFLKERNRNLYATFATLRAGFLFFALPINIASAQANESLVRVAEQLLGAAISCPQGLEERIGKAGKRGVQKQNVVISNRFYGDAAKFRILAREKKLASDNPGARIRNTTKRIEFKYSDIALVQQRGRRVSFFCKAEALCILETFKADNSQERLPTYSLFACDSKSAQNIKAAADVLIKQIGQAYDSSRAKKIWL